MDKCSYFIENKALFGSSPSQETADELEQMGVKYFIDLTFPTERHIVPYTTKFTKIRFPIRDRGIPDNAIQFCAFVLRISEILKSLKPSSNDKLYIHCKGGHGRSGILVASLFCVHFKKNVEEALQMTTLCHSNRKTMREKWRTIGSPQTLAQKEFVRQIFEPIIYDSHQFTCFSTLSSNSIDVMSLGVFPTSEACYQAFKNPVNEDFIAKLKNPENDPMALGKKIKLRDDKDWNKIKIYVMYTVMRLKFDQYPEHKNVLLHTYLRPIIRYSNHTTFWCNMQNNVYGRLLEKLRNEYLRAFF